ncbi:uncharacterized protein LOC127000662 isoform X6 [Eriocheir sinensis]|uniref:uncharacterized protein LOC127000662 isoform X6 n=1 Tax=Eriocheir sinensis TaxID=95602 RepID=UPI0021C8DBDF|nr:uncharacterized protein LOC127000662 isoform X6 [Eriocheir sinensis]
MAEDTGQGEGSCLTGVTGTAGGRHYRKGHQVTHREDMTHEYKGHRCISVYDLPAHMTTSDPGADLRRTKSAVSASVCGMLNTGFGGTVYLGVDDGGRVVGLPLTRPAPSVVGGGAGGGVGAAHHVATPRPCWCDREARRHVTAPPEWVVEIHLRPWDLSSQERFPLPPQEPPKPPLPPLPPLHLTEANVCYYRHGARQITLSLDDIRRLLAHRTHRYYTRRLAALRTYLGELQGKVREHGLEGELEGRKRRGCGGESRREGVEDMREGGEMEESLCVEKKDIGCREERMGAIGRKGKR